MKRIPAIALALILTLVLFSACGTTAPATPAASPSSEPAAGAVPESQAPAVSAAPGAKSDVVFMVIDSFTKEPTAPLYIEVEEYQKANENCTVTIEAVPATNIKDKFTNAALAGAGPDIISLDTGGWIVDAAAIGTIAPLDDRIAAIRDNFQEGSLQAGAYSGNIYAVPWYLNNAGLYYNNAILKEAGIEKVPATWDEFAAALDAVSKTGKKGLSIGIKGAYYMYPFFFQNENPVIDTSGEKPVSALDQESAKEAFRYFTEFHTKYNAFPESTKDALAWDQIYAPFIQGDCAFMICGDWGNAPVKSGAPDLDFGIAPLPVGKKAATVMGGYSLCINANSKDQDGAWNFIQYLTSKEQNDVLLEYGRIGARKDIDQQALINQSPHLEQFILQAGSTYPRPGIKALADADDIFSEAFQNVYLGVKDADTALAECHEKLNALLQDKYK